MRLFSLLALLSLLAGCAPSLPQATASGEPAADTTATGTNCRNVTVYERRTRTETNLVSRQVSCQHCGTTPTGYRCEHQYDTETVPRQTSMTIDVPVTRRVCD